MANLSQQKRQRILEFLDTLRQERANDDEALIAINEIENELLDKKYGLVWEKHEEKIDALMRDNIPVFTECKSKEIDEAPGESYNFILEGDNLQSLRLLEKTHFGRIGVIYIDPPYNRRKNNDFKYDDNYVAKDDGYGHSKWLSFMDERLRIAWNLLSDDGIIMISIDDNEQAQLKILCDEIFGEENRLSTHHIQVRYDNKTLNKKNDWQPVMEYVLIYAKSDQKFKANRPKKDYSIDKFVYSFEELSEGTTFEANGRKVTVFKKNEWRIDKHSVPDDSFLKETWVSGSIYSGTGNGPMVQNIIEPRIQIDGYGSLYKIYGLGEDGLGYRYFTGPQKKGAKRCKMYTGVPLTKKENILSGTAVEYDSIPNIYDFSPDFGNISHEGGIAFNNGKKPIKMLKQLINYQPDKNAIVLDFFAGSGSTGHAVLELNAEDGGNRRFILCNDSENNICEDITYERIKNVIKGYGNTKGLPANLKYFRTDFVPKDSENITQDLLEHVAEMVELERGIKLDGKHYQLVLSDEEADDLEAHWNEYPNLKALYVSREVLLTRTQQNLFGSIDMYTIPDYYFKFDLKEVGEAW